MMYQLKWIAVLFALSIGCDRYGAQVENQSSRRPNRLLVGNKISDEISEDHSHRGGALAGVLTSLGQDEYHAEAVLQDNGRLEIFIFGPDETRMHEIDQQSLTAYVKPADGSLSTMILMSADPLPDDSADKTTRFAGILPERFRNGSFFITVPGLRIEGQRFTARFALSDSFDAMMPKGVGDEEAEELYLAAGGLYTEADIEANGRSTAALTYRGFRAEHDANPQFGDWLCPVTLTKANPKCVWIIGGETYYFCCPPCIDEFLTWAKTDPERVKPAASYRK
jgi:YHS domain-containing protein